MKFETPSERFQRSEKPVWIASFYFHAMLNIINGVWCYRKISHRLLVTFKAFLMRAYRFDEIKLLNKFLETTCTDRLSPPTQPHRLIVLCASERRSSTINCVKNVKILSIAWDKIFSVLFSTNGAIQFNISHSHTALLRDQNLSLACDLHESWESRWNAAAVGAQGYTGNRWRKNYFHKFSRAVKGKLVN